MTTIYRAANEPNGQHWAYDLSAAVAYRHNEPFGGETIYQATDEGLSVLDLRGEHEAFLTEVVGDDWGQRHEWCAAWALEDKAVTAYLQANGYDAVRYLDDYPNEADVLYVLDGRDGSTVDITVRDGLALALEALPTWRANSLHQFAAEWAAARATDEDGDRRDASDLDSDQILSLLRTGTASDGDFTLTLREDA